MRNRLTGPSLLLLVAAMILPMLALGTTAPVQAAQRFADPRFEQQWAQGEALAPNFWGPLANATDGVSEPYRESANGQRLVQYFDKGRMEITGSIVTNGLLATELTTGQRQLGDADFQFVSPPTIPIAGDPDNPGPTYDGLYRNAVAIFEPAGRRDGASVPFFLTPDGTPRSQESVAGAGPMMLVAYDDATRHNVAQAFADYRNRVGLLTIGYAKSEPFQTEVKVAGQNRQVMVQVFERRILTYTPDNPAAFRVEMGNIGLHYYRWRYGQAPPPPPPGPEGWRPLTGPHIGYGFNGFFTFKPAGTPASLANLERSLDLVKEAKFSWIRQQIVWATLEPAPGQYAPDQLAALDAIVREANQRRLAVMFTITKSPRWAVASDNGCEEGGEVKLCGLPQNPQSLANIMRYLADRYKEGSSFGRVRAWEIWNEQNTGGETAKNVDAGTYVEQLKAAYTAVKAADPRAIVVFGGLTPTGVMDKTLAIDDVVYLEQVYQYNNGEVKRYFDVLGAHPGSNNNGPDARWPSDNREEATRICAQQGRRWCDHPSFYFQRIEQLRGVMEKYNDALYGTRLKQIWLTEFGWTTANQAPGYEYGAQISEELQAQYLVRALEKGQRDYPWMGVMFIWTLNHAVVVPPSDEKYPWSLIRDDWSRRPAFIAVKEMDKP